MLLRVAKGKSIMSTNGPLAILDSTLREGEQFAGAFFSLEQRLEIAIQLDALGVTFIEVPSPIVSRETRSAVQALC